ncbi:MAG: glycosyltransferase family 1 protein, partial [Clostridium sp.]|uniref:glycosyltransferase family 4 protein n=1 Tax=Clostridium sp. TaxID=1506 RepID=UPI0039E957E9
KEYILTVSTISPRKNIDGLIKAFNMIKNKVNCNLIIAGKNGWMYEDIFKLVETLDLKNKIFFTGSINDDELKFLYKNSKLFVYPSLYEGFGLPPLEAMSYGIPCIVSNRTCIPEVVGDAAIKVNPEDLYEVGNIIVEILKNKEMSSDLLSKANDRLKYFSWKKCSNGVVNIYLVKNKI